MTYQKRLRKMAQRLADLQDVPGCDENASVCDAGATALALTSKIAKMEMTPSWCKFCIDIDGAHHPDCLYLACRRLHEA